nr:MAG TPA: hypothetical protein [Caudoviricetes sp.]
MGLVHIRGKFYRMSFWMFLNYSPNKLFILFN